MFVNLSCAVFGIWSWCYGVEAKKLFVANNGLDSAICGTAINPCRSLSRAIANASPGDDIVVGPGRYGDLNGNGTFGETGEETAPGGCSCMVLVNKQLTITSRDGAGATVLAAGGADISVVWITASKVIFGKKKQGFTLTHGRSGLVIISPATGVRVESNLAIANTSHGFAFGGSVHVLTGNLASANGENGFGFGGKGDVLTGNLAIANRADGFEFSGSKHVLTGNAALGNNGFGIRIFDSGGVDSATITKNNLFGNNAENFGGFINCGLLNQSEDPISAPNNFWGVAGGPGTQTLPKPEPADNVCNDPGSKTTVAPAAKKGFKVNVKVLEEFPAGVVPGFAPAFLPRATSNSPLSLYSLAGQRIAIVSDQTQLALTISHLPNGVYLAIKVYADGRRELVKIGVRR